MAQKTGQVTETMIGQTKDKQIITTKHGNCRPSKHMATQRKTNCYILCTTLMYVPEIKNRGRVEVLKELKYS